VRSHADEQVRERHRRTRRIRLTTVGVPLAPEDGIGGLDFLAEPFV